MHRSQRRTRRKFSAEFKRDAVELVLSGGTSVAGAARELGVYDSTPGNWVEQARIDRGQQEGLSTEERTRLRELEQDNAKLRMERDLLKRAHSEVRRSTSFSCSNRQRHILAPLMPTGWLRLARCVVDDGWNLRRG